MIDFNEFYEFAKVDFNSTKEAITKMVSGENQGALCYVVPIKIPDTVIPGVPFKSDCSYGEINIENLPLILKAKLAYVKSRKWGHDHGIPMIQPCVLGYGPIQNAFGAKYTYVPCGTVPVIESLDDIDKLPDVSIDSYPFNNVYKLVEYLYNHTEGQIPIEMYNEGGPFSNASLIVRNTEILEGIYTNPGAVHYLFNKLTDLFIGFVKKEKEFAPNLVMNCMHDTWWPDDLGVLCQDDSIINLSPKQFAEFVVPYYNRISDAFGGIMIHCCGEFSHLFSTMRDGIRNLRGIWFNAGECNIEKAVEVFKGTNTVLIPRWVLNQVYHFRDRIDFIKYILKLKTPDLSMFIQAHSFGDLSYTDPGAIVPEQDHNAASEAILDILRYYEKTGRVKG